MMTEVEEEGLPCEEQQPGSSSDDPEDLTAAARSKDTEKLAPEPEEQAPVTQERAPETEKRAPDTQGRSPQAEKRAPAMQQRSPQPEKREPDTQERAPETEERPPDTEKRAPVPPPVTEAPPPPLLEASASVDPSLLQYKLRKFFVLRPGTVNQAIKDIQALVDKEVDGNVHGVWLMTEVDHWNNDRERLVLVTDSSLLVFKYDFVLFNCERFTRIPLNFVDRISHGGFTFPKPSLLKREGEGVRVFWDRPREPTFTSRWNPFSTDYPFLTFTHHPARNASDSFAVLCDIHTFQEKLRETALKLHALKPVPGKANGIMVLNQEILIETYVGLMSFLGNENKLGYSMARGNIGY